MNPLRIVYRRTLAAAQRLLNALGLNAMRLADYYSPLPVLGRLAERRERWGGALTDVEAVLAELKPIALRTSSSVSSACSRAASETASGICITRSRASAKTSAACSVRRASMASNTCMPRR